MSAIHRDKVGGAMQRSHAVGSRYLGERSARRSDALANLRQVWLVPKGRQRARLRDPVNPEVWTQGGGISSDGHMHDADGWCMARQVGIMHDCESCRTPR